jgi:hypothetical protein
MKVFPILWPFIRSAEGLVMEALRCPREVPWDFVASHHVRCLLNHGQTVERLAERGGLSPHEMLAVVTDRPYQEVANLTFGGAVMELKSVLHEALLSSESRAMLEAGLADVRAGRVTTLNLDDLDPDEES